MSHSNILFRKTKWFEVLKTTNRSDRPAITFNVYSPTESPPGIKG
jgi:hypothetical protein